MLERRRNNWTLGIVSVALFMVVLDNLVVSVALPTIHRDLGASIQSLEWTVNAYVLAYAVLLLTGAALGDRFGRKRMFMVGLSVFTVASAAAALAPSTGLLVAARAVQGAGAAVVTPLTLTLLAEAFAASRDGDRRVVWNLGRRRGNRAAHRRRGRTGHLLALDLLDQRSDRPAHPPTCSTLASRELWALWNARPTRTGAGLERGVWDRVRSRESTVAGLD